MLAQLKGIHSPHHYAQASTALKPTTGVPYGSTLYETDTALWYIFTLAGWVLESLPAIAAITSALPAGTNNIGKVTLEGEIPAGTKNIGDVDVASLPGTVQADIAAMKAKIDTIQADIALIKAQDLPPGVGTYDFVFDADDLVKSVAVGVAGLLKGIHLIVPNFTNSVTATLTLTNAAGYVLWTSAAKAKGNPFAFYNLETDTAGVWADQVVMAPFLLVCTLSGAAGGAGGTVNALARYLGA